MELIKADHSRYEEYENLLLQRDQLKKEAEQIWIAYVNVFGQLIADVYEEQLECVKRKKTIQHYQRALNRGEPIDVEMVQSALEDEMVSYYAHLRELQEENTRCANAEYSTAYAAERSKVLYRRLAKLLHPDINPHTDSEEILQELWNRALRAYGCNNVRELSELEVLTRKALRELGIGEIKVELPDIDERIDALNREIDEIVNSEPYTHRVLLSNPEAVERKKAGLTEELEDFRRYRVELDAVIRSMLEEGGVAQTWPMN